MMSSRPSLWDAYGPAGDSEGGGAFGVDTEGTRDSSPPLPSPPPPPPPLRPPQPWSQPSPTPSSAPLPWSLGDRSALLRPATAAPVPYAAYLKGAATSTQTQVLSDSLRTVGLLLGAALAFGVAVFALTGDSSAFASLAAYAPGRVDKCVPGHTPASRGCA